MTMATLIKAFAEHPRQLPEFHHQSPQKPASMDLGARSRIIAGPTEGHLARYEAPGSTLSEPSVTGFPGIRQIRPLVGSEPISVA